MPRVVVALLVALAGCPHPPTGPTGTIPAGSVGKITWARVETAADVPKNPPAPGSFRIHLIDVGTGLAILVQGHDFAMLYDAGTNDKEERPRRDSYIITIAP
jgi:beta-lactamase superfamily II metal-dependent hydrolase